MLKGMNDSQLISGGILSEVVPFFQVWQELVHAKTLDIYQYNLFTSLSVLEELITVIEKTINGFLISDANIESCRMEALYIVKSDQILERFYPTIHDRLRMCLAEKPKTDPEKHRMLAQISYIYKQIKPTYEKNTLSELKSAIQTKDITKIQVYANMVASMASHKGWSQLALTEMKRFFISNKSFEDQWRQFEQAILSDAKQDFDVLIYIPFKSQRNEDEKDITQIMSELELEVLSCEQLMNEYAYLEDVEKLLNADKKYFRVKVKAFDAYSAAHTAIRTISERLNMASFYNLVSAWDLSLVNFVVINCVSGYHKPIQTKQLYKTYDYLESSGSIFLFTKSIFSDEEKRAIREKLNGSFGYANISRASLFQEEKYMNLWVALESLSRTTMYQDIISNVKQTVPAAMCIRYLYRVIRNYVEDCIRCGVDFSFEDYEVDVQQDSKRNLVNQTIELFTNDDKYERLLEKCSVNTLLHSRTETIHRLLKETAYLKAKVVNHHDRVEWQIQRLYRIRNEITHAALQNETSLIPYIEHLYDYLATYITEIVSCIYTKKKDTIEEALMHIKDNYDIFLSYADSKHDDCLKETILKTGVIELV